MQNELVTNRIKNTFVVFQYNKQSLIDGTLGDLHLRRNEETVKRCKQQSSSPILDVDSPTFLESLRKIQN